MVIFSASHKVQLSHNTVILHRGNESREIKTYVHKGPVGIHICTNHQSQELETVQTSPNGQGDM